MGLRKAERVVISRKAQKSIREIYDYIKEQESIAAAKKVRDEITHQCRELKDFSGYSAERYLSDMDAEYRSVTKWDYNIIYTVSEKEVRIMNVIHTSRHPDNRRDI